MAQQENAVLYPQLIEASRDLEQALKDFVADKPLPLLVQAPQPGKWSFLECIAHLDLTYQDYLPRLEAAIEKGRHLKGTHYKQGFFGKMMINSMLPKDGKLKMKVKTFAKFTPEPTDGLDVSIIDGFLAKHRQFLALLEAAQPLHGGRIRLDSAIGRLLRFRLGDCCAFLVGHNERHWIQAQNAYAAVRSASKDGMVNFQL